MNRVLRTAAAAAALVCAASGDASAQRGPVSKPGEPKEPARDSRAPIELRWFDPSIGPVDVLLDPSFWSLDGPAQLIGEDLLKGLTEELVDHLGESLSGLVYVNLPGLRATTAPVVVREFILFRAGDCTLIACRTSVQPAVILQPVVSRAGVDPRTGRLFRGDQLAVREGAALATSGVGFGVQAGFFLLDVANAHADVELDRLQGMGRASYVHYAGPVAGMVLSSLVGNAALTGTFAALPVVGTVATGLAAGAAGAVGVAVIYAAAQGAHILESHARRREVEETSEALVRRHIEILRSRGVEDVAIAETLDRFGVPPQQRSQYLGGGGSCHGCTAPAGGPRGPTSVDLPPTGTLPSLPNRDTRGGVSADVKVNEGDFRRSPPPRPGRQP